MCKAMQRYLLGEADAIVPGLPAQDKSLIAWMLENIKDKNGHVRHHKWLDAISQSKFSFGAANVDYIPKGQGSWKYQALGTEKLVDRENEIFPYHPSFLVSNWKLFHDALQAHQFYIIHDLLPQYGICVA
jgi:hypothetical protein